ncbi:hypothetical protein CXB51_025763 [Gossypium anomalum]|uniref:XRCC4 N-terminal domain-containing protein n=1 Tax=Gossypium anomalum TaxID=47600 RepID=A0A8J5YKF8_9ROSI|nr:hypothetical protein CXB51_025763 [Gossypium anomalum]
MESSSTATARHTCLKLEIPSTDPLFVKGTWFDTHFHLSVTDGSALGSATVLLPTEEEVQERAAQWDQPVAEYIELAERYLGFQQPDSVYQFVDAGDDHKRLSWTFERDGTKLEWRWKFQLSNDSRKITAGILDFLMDANINLSVFLGVLNSKKAKLRELRDQLSKQEIAGKASVDEEESTDKTESYHSGSNAEESEEKKLKRTSQAVQRIFQQAEVVVERELHVSNDLVEHRLIGDLIRMQKKNKKNLVHGVMIIEFLVPDLLLLLNLM